MSAPTQQLPHTLKETRFQGLGPLYRGKVRDVYDWGEHLAIVTTDRVSAFDRVLGTIPFKGQLLSQMAVYGFEQTAPVAPNHVVACPHPNVIVGKKCRAFPVEFVVRGYVTGSLWRDLQSGAAAAYEVSLPKAARKDEALPQPILTPATKAEIGQHDEPTSRAKILDAGWMTEAEFEQAQDCALRLFSRGRELADSRGLILVDTKYELGLDSSGTMTVMDEIHTPDSSRYWFKESYQALFEAGQPQRMLDKENLRAWLLDRNYQGDGPPPVLSDALRVDLFEKYRTAFEALTGRNFACEVGSVEGAVEAALRTAFADLS